ncbi:triphosphoribosyl-dephospho-CoA synthase MdcB [Methylobacterium planeticum]|uniref:Probable 2-(5''-triphosphoribosyl)-3'-dephosphocoenzyme-A synthase n=1 Tax=Methylobacterium planeticum TaxID=2615211 RepID=A0A6N6MQA2_9HYPH|nr:triphosphoribosyl-dephospho-CoA synthase MdcB [Methylobacterium planeticum]KAB1072795.1 triphosphoribosyl-dephospho-CoA synthase MdcB [Methylobacterium planeticum]
MSALAVAWRAPAETGLPEAIARLAVACLHGELETYPKPGLVSHVDSGSHADMDADTFRASAAALEPAFADLARAGAAGEPMPALRRIGIAAEAAMRTATGGVNTHRGAIFGLGLLCAAAGATRPGPPARTDRAPQPTRGRILEIDRNRNRDGCETAFAGGPLGALVRSRYAEGILDGPVLLHAPGARARRRHGVGGAPAEAAAGFPTLYGVGLPALRRGRRLRPQDPEAARVEACLALIAHLEDTNLLHRGGPEGYAFARTEAARFIAEGGVARADWRARAEALHRRFVDRNLSPGGAADLLAMTLFVDAAEGDAAGGEAR